MQNPPYVDVVIAFKRYVDCWRYRDQRRIRFIGRDEDGKGIKPEMLRPEYQQGGAETDCQEQGGMVAPLG